MSDSTNGSAENQIASGETEKSQTDKVAYETYKRVLAEAKKLKEENRLFKEQQAAKEEEKLKEQNQWKVLAETKAQQAEQLKKQFDELNSQVLNGMKYQEFEKHLGGKLKDSDYATFIDFEKIVINPETKRVDEESVKAVASEFVKKHSHLVEFVDAKRLPNKAGGSVTEIQKNPSEMNQKEREEFLRNSLSSLLK